MMFNLIKFFISLPRIHKNSNFLLYVVQQFMKQSGVELTRSLASVRLSNCHNRQMAEPLMAEPLMAFREIWRLVNGR
jgi:hypothetical protein